MLRVGASEVPLLKSVQNCVWLLSNRHKILYRELLGGEPALSFFFLASLLWIGMFS